jgi:hypothetical protein
MMFVWPTPIVGGAAATKVNVGRIHGGLCALVIGRRTDVAVIINTRDKVIKVAIVLFFANFIFFLFL